MKELVKTSRRQPTMPQKSTYHLAVLEVTQLSPHLKRLMLTGTELGSFPPGYEGGYVKLLLHRLAQSNTTGKPERVLKRSFTVRAFDAEALTLTLDFALHKTRGPALTWADEATPGTQISIIGPGPVKMLDTTAEWFLLPGRLTALPAIAVNLEHLSDGSARSRCH